MRKGGSKSWYVWNVIIRNANIWISRDLYLYLHGCWGIDDRLEKNRTRYACRITSISRWHNFYTKFAEVARRKLQCAKIVHARKFPSVSILALLYLEFVIEKNQITVVFASRARKLEITARCFGENPLRFMVPNEMLASPATCTNWPNFIRQPRPDRFNPRVWKAEEQEQEQEAEDEEEGINENTRLWFPERSTADNSLAPKT